MILALMLLALEPALVIAIWPEPPAIEFATILDYPVIA